jgi:Bacterial Ig-like domain
MSFEIKIARVAAMMCVAAALAACGGGGGDAPAPAPALAMTSDALSREAVEGSSPIAVSLTGVTTASGAVTWGLSPTVGTLSGTSASGAVYTPPGIGSLTAPTVVTITATPARGSAATLQFTITLVPFDVAGTTPAAGDNVDVTVQPTVQFTRAIAPAPSASSATLASPVAAVPVGLAASGATLTLSPATPLVWGGHYTISLTSDVVSSVGQALAPTSFSFDVAAPVWRAPAQLAASTFTAGTPFVAMNKSGQGFAVWQQDTDGTGTWNIQASRFNLGTRAWSSPVALHAGSHAQVAPVVATDVTGNAIAAWSEDDGNFTYNVYAARFAAAQGSWGPATLIQTVLGETAQSPQVVMDADGNGMVVWQQYTGPSLSMAVYAARFDASSESWASAVQLDSGTGARGPQVALDASGNAFAVWEQASAGSLGQVASARWSRSSGAWSAAQVIQPSTLSGGNAQLAVAPNGDATVVWTQLESNGTITIQAARRSASSGAWSTPVALTPATGASSGRWPQAQADPAGNVIALWYQHQGAGVYSVDAARFDAASGQWSAPAHIETLQTALSYSPYSWAPSLVVDAAGNATAAWARDDGSGVHNAFQARFDSHTVQWSVPGSLSGSVNVPDRVFTAVDAQGSVLVTWGVRDEYLFQTPWWTLLTGP